MLDDIARISSEFDAALAAANTASALEELRVHYFGRKGGLIPALFSRLKEVSKDQKKAVGEALNNFRDYAQASYEEKIAALVAEALDGKTRDIIDVTLPARLPNLGHLHPVTIVRRTESQAVIKGVEEGATIALAEPGRRTKNTRANGPLGALGK